MLHLGNPGVCAGILSNTRLDSTIPATGRLFPWWPKRGESVIQQHQESALDRNSQLPCSENFSDVWRNNFQDWSTVCLLLLSAHRQTTDNAFLSYLRETMEIIVKNIFNCFEPNQPVNICWRFHCVQIVAAVWAHSNRHLGEDEHWAKRPGFEPQLCHQFLVWPSITPLTPTTSSFPAEECPPPAYLAGLLGESNERSLQKHCGKYNVLTNAMTYY